VIQGDAGEARDGQSRGKRSRLYWHKRAIGMNDAVEPSVWDFKRKKVAAWLQDAVNFREGAILQFARAQMMQDKNSNRRGEDAVGKGQRSRVALHDAGAFSVLLRQARSRFMVIFETDDMRDAFSQFGSGSARTRPNFQKVIAQIRLP